MRKNKFINDKIFNFSLSSEINISFEFDVIIKTYFYYYRPKKTDIVIDCGACFGLFSLFISPYVKKVIAFEPDPNNYKKLVDNINKNNIDNIIPIQKGVFDKNQTIDFYINNECCEWSSIFEDVNLGNKQKVSIEVVKLDDEIKKLGIEKVDFIKMDIEGSELEALKGMKSILKTKCKFVICSYHKKDGKISQSFEIEEYLKKNNIDYIIDTEQEDPKIYTK